MSERLASKHPASAGTAPLTTEAQPSGAPGAGSADAARLRERVQSLRLPATMTAQRSGASRLPWLLTFLLAVAVGWLAYQLYVRPVAQPATGPSALVPDAPVAPELGDVSLESKGYIVPAHQVLVSPQVSGRVEKLFIEEGRRFHRGDVLAELEKTEYLADVSRAQAVLAAMRQKLLELERGNRPEEIEQARAELAEYIAQRDQLKVDWERNQRLRPTKTVADVDYEKSESSFHAMDARVKKLQESLKLMIEGPRQERIDLARAEVQQAEADVVKTRWRLENTTIRAPVSGTILKKNAEEGNIVNSLAMNGSFSLCEMADLSDLEVDLAIQERDVAQVRQGQRCRVKSDAYQDRVYEGVVSRLMPIADRAKGAVPVRVKVRVPADEEGVYLKPEMGVLVSFLREGAAPPLGNAASKPAASPVPQ
ncbi:MAG: efflux RND transporter periplasmic adaptor subunit [Planctomycetes bacterium]|nr:efflux RND transporter periplasmic adaptor subunit [Planctomycetota bacterium]